MVICKFALLIAIAPQKVNDWFLTVYTDAYEWFELPNVSSMDHFSDADVFAIKSYPANCLPVIRMSTRHNACHKKVAKTNGSDACPFNYLYWHFIHRNGPLLEANIRMKMPCRIRAKISAVKLDIADLVSKLFLATFLDLV